MLLSRPSAGTKTAIGSFAVVITLNLTSGSYHDVVVSLRPNDSSTARTASRFCGRIARPIVNSGNVITTMLLQNATNAPTILVTGGNHTPQRLDPGEHRLCLGGH